ncbi:hypothetical protein [Vibrio gallaecicus]|nr:hypothetical protein [Vibrio gallaecicus]MDN3614398.1 hypothetical protein [Vibrio gallaecicus]
MRELIIQVNMLASIPCCIAHVWALATSSTNNYCNSDIAELGNCFA